MPTEERAAKALALLLGAGAFWYGLYSPAQQLIATAMLAAAVLVLAPGKGGTHDSGKRCAAPSPATWGSVALSRSEAVALACLAVGAGTSLLNPAATGVALHGPLVMAGWVLAMLWGRGLAVRGGDSALRFLVRMWAVVGPLMVFGGIVGMSYLPVHHSGRLASFVGYPIALGMLGLLGAAGVLPAVQQGRWWAPALLFGNALAVLLSGSRGVWAVAALLALYLRWAAPGLLRRSWWPVAGAVVAALWAGPAVAMGAPAPALAAFLIGTLAAARVGWFLARPVLSAALLMTAAGLAPGWGWLLGRAHPFSMADGSSVERLTFLRDGLAVARSLPLGAGYRAWTALHLQHASYGYYSAEVHSAPLEIAISFGWVAAVGFVLLLARFWWGLRQGRDWAPDRVAALAGLGALALHALLDWELSYALFMIPLWFGIGLMGTAAPRPLRLPFGVTVAIAALSLAGGAVLGAGDSFTAASARSLSAGSPESAYLHASMAATVTPWDDQAHVAGARALSALGNREAALAAIARARRLGPNEPWYAHLEALELLRAGRLREAAAAYREAVRLWPWSVAGYEEALQAHMDLVLRADLLGDQALSADLIRGGRTLIAALDRQRAQEPPGMPRRAMQTDTPILRRARSFFAP